MKNFFTITVLAAAAAVHAETNTLPVITVTASSQSAVHSDIREALRTEPGVVLNSQGGSQNDLSIRGSSFSGAGLSLGGLKLNNPQTEHFNAELPLPAGILSRAEIQTGLDNQGGHLAGTVGFNLLPVTGIKQASAGFGSDHRDWQSLLLQHMLSDHLGAGVFAGRESASGVDYPDNDFDREYIGSHIQHQHDDTQVDLAVSHQRKEFGARGYYGVPDDRYAYEETDETLIYLNAMQGSMHAAYLRTGMAWREFNDHYWIPSWAYENHHRSRTASAFVDGRTIELNGWALGWRADVEEERISSTGLGWHHRTRGGVSLLPQWSTDRLTVTVGARSEFFSEESAEFLPQIGAEYMLSDNLTCFASYSESVRLPSYTELNYNSPTSLGNAGLKPQTAAQTEIGFKGIPSASMDWKAVVFHRRSGNTIDWQKIAETDLLWQATDIGTLNTAGLETSLGWYPAQNVETRLAYTWLHKDKTAADFSAYASRYALDYPEHLAQASLLWRPISAVELGTVQTLRLQTDNAAREGDNLGLDCSFVVRFTPPQAEYATIALQIQNAWDDDFQYFPGQLSPGRYTGLSLTLNW